LSKESSTEVQALILLEYANCCLQFFKSTKGLKAIEQAKELIGLKIEETGKMGRRTKY